jgi:colicin import membrane protein
MDLGNMAEDVFDAYYEAQKSKRAKEIEQKKKDEEEAKIKAELEAKERAEAEKKAKAEALAKAKAAAEQTAKLKKEKAEADKLLEEARKEADRLDRENNILKAKQKMIDDEIEAKRVRESEVADAEILKPIEEKLTEWVNSFSLPEAPESNDKTTLIINKFESFKLWAQKQI